MQAEDPFVATLQRWMEVSMRRSMRHFVRYARDSGLSMSQLGALFHLHRRGIMGVTDLGEHLGVTSAAASQMLERLVQQGLIQRSEDPHDRRVKQIVLTEKGSLALKESIHARQSWLEEVAVCLSESDKKQISEALEILIESTEPVGKSSEEERLGVSGMET